MEGHGPELGNGHWPGLEHGLGDGKVTSLGGGTWHEKQGASEKGLGRRQRPTSASYEPSVIMPRASRDVA